MAVFSFPFFFLGGGGGGLDILCFKGGGKWNLPSSPFFGGEGELIAGIGSLIEGVGVSGVVGGGGGGRRVLHLCLDLFGTVIFGPGGGGR